MTGPTIFSLGHLVGDEWTGELYYRMQGSSIGTEEDLIAAVGSSYHESGELTDLNDSAAENLIKILESNGYLVIDRNVVRAQPD